MGCGETGRGHNRIEHFASVRLAGWLALSAQSLGWTSSSSGTGGASSSNSRVGGQESAGLARLAGR